MRLLASVVSETIRKYLGSVFIIILSFMLMTIFSAEAQSPSARYELNLSGEWDFEQTYKAYPPKKFTRKIPVPGLIDQANPKIDQYNELFMGDQDTKYSWYRCKFFVPEEGHGKKAILTVLKSRFNTRVILNDIDLGTYWQASTPIEANLTDHLNLDGENILLIRIDDIKRISKESAFSMDIEQFTYIQGIWDEVFISFTGPVRVARSLCLPFAKDEKVKVKLLLENHDDKIRREFSLLEYETEVSVFIREKKSGKVVSDIVGISTKVKCLNQKEVELEIPIAQIKLWSPDTPFLYEAVIEVVTLDEKSDNLVETFGIRDFGTNGKRFELNGDEIKLLGSNISLSRFMGDPDRAGLIWDKEWVKKFLIDIPKALRWNSFRMCLGLAPDFWYDLADEYGIMIQNEWPMWKNRGWDGQIEHEFTDWVWADGSHPSIVIWDAMNESRHNFIGNELIPRLKKLDPTRIWDVGYMDERDLLLNEMDEPHYYPLLVTQRSDKEKLQQRRLNYRFGQLYYENNYLDRSRYSPVPQVLNEYGWMWMNRDGTPAFLSKARTDPDDKLPQKHYFRPMNEWENEKNKTIGHFEYFLGIEANAKDRWDFQAYYIQLQTEALRSRRYIAGVQGFCYLTFNKGYTGDWFLNPIKDLVPSETLKWQFHCYAPFAVFIDEEDGRYLKNPKKFIPGKSHTFKLFGINDTSSDQQGTLSLKLIDAVGNVVTRESFEVKIGPHFEQNMAVNIVLPKKTGGYLLLSELIDSNNITQISRRYIRVGDTVEDVPFPDYKIELSDSRYSSNAH